MAMDKQFAFAIVVIVLFGTLGAKVCLINRKNIFISEVMIGRPLGVVWTFLSEPGKYARLYPNWIKTIELVGGDTYKVEDRFGGSNSIAVIRNKEFGVIDLHIGNETSRLRLFAEGDNQTLAVHVARRWGRHKRSGLVLSQTNN